MADLEKALSVAKNFISAFEACNPAAVGQLLSDNSRLVIRLNIDGTPNPWYAFDGKEHILAYISSVGAKFDHVTFNDQEWTVSHDARSVFVQANGDIISTAEKLTYNNVYVFKFELEGQKIKQVIEYANPVTYANLGIENSEAEQAAQS